MVCVDWYPGGDRCAAAVLLEEGSSGVVIARQSCPQGRRRVEVKPVYDAPTRIADVRRLACEAPPQIALDRYIPGMKLPLSQIEWYREETRVFQNGKACIDYPVSRDVEDNLIREARGH